MFQRYRQPSHGGTQADCSPPPHCPADLLPEVAKLQGSVPQAENVPGKSTSLQTRENWSALSEEKRRDELQLQPEEGGSEETAAEVCRREGAFSLCGPPRSQPSAETQAETSTTGHTTNPQNPSKVRTFQTIFDSSCEQG